MKGRRRETCKHTRGRWGNARSKEMVEISNFIQFTYSMPPERFVLLSIPSDLYLAQLQSAVAAAGCLLIFQSACLHLAHSTRDHHETYPKVQGVQPRISPSQRFLFIVIVRCKRAETMLSNITQSQCRWRRMMLWYVGRSQEERSKNFTQFQAENKACNCIHSEDKKKKKKIANWEMREK